MKLVLSVLALTTTSLLFAHQGEHFIPLKKEYEMAQRSEFINKGILSTEGQTNLLLVGIDPIGELSKIFRQRRLNNKIRPKIKKARATQEKIKNDQLLSELIGPMREVFRLPLNHHYEETLTINSRRQYQSDTPYMIPNTLFNSYQINLKFEANFIQKMLGQVVGRVAQLPVRVNCEKDVTLYLGGRIISGNRHSLASKIIDIPLLGDTTPRLKLKDAKNNCSLYRADRDRENFLVIKSMPSEHILPRLLKARDMCATDISKSNGDPKNLKEVFFSSRWDHFTCPLEIDLTDKTTFLRGPYFSFNARVRRLLGRDLTHNEISAQDPFIDLDFSQAPKLDFILVSSLNFTSDFYGNLLARLLKYHASQGTHIEIFVAAPVLSSKDNALLRSMREFSPNFRIRRHRHQNIYLRDGTLVDTLHRVNHIKSFIGISLENPELSFSISGGRNIRDSYIFDEKPDHSSRPGLTDYASGEAAFVYYDDFDILIEDHQFVLQKTAQIMKYIYQDNTQWFTPKSLVINSKALSNSPNFSEGQIRHFLSIPHSDNYALEDFFVTLINNSNESIYMTTPYFRPTPRITQALNEAIERGVQINVLTRINLAGDGVPSLAEDVNKSGINEFFEKANIYEWTEPASIMHAKIAVFDDTIGKVSSININSRTFWHDLEHAIIYYDTEKSISLREEIKNYMRDATLIEEKEKIKFYNRWILSLTGSFF